MIRAVVWKELREQGLIAATLAVLGVGLMVAAAALGDPPNSSAPPGDVLALLGPGRLLTIMLVVTAGMVCGGALFAAEKEAGTATFLEALPASRWKLWEAKIAAGALLAALEVALLSAAAALLGLADGPFAARLVVYALLAFAWGTLGSTLARTTLGSVGVAIPAATVATFAFLLPIYLFLAHPGSGAPRPLGWLIFQALMVGTPLGVSAWRFTAPDRLRAASGHYRTLPGAAPGSAAGPGAARHGPGAGMGYHALAWLALRQLRVPGLVLSAFALSFGAALLLPDMRVVFLWPPLALAAGVLAGVTAFGDEQARRTALFWGEHRLPVGRAWLVKVSAHLLLLGWLLILLALPCAIRAQVAPAGRFEYGQSRLAAAFHTRLFDELGSQGWKYLVVPAVYGFAFGHLCGILFRKLVVACGVAAMVGGVFAALWLPSLLAGGVRHWQLWAPAALVLLTARLLIRSWACERTAERDAILRAAVGLAAVVAVAGAGVGFRVLQVRDDPAGGDDVAFAGSLPGYDENLGGREFRMAAERFARAAAGAPEGVSLPDTRRRTRIEERLETAVRFGWPGDDPELDLWVERVYNHPPSGTDDKSWPALAEQAAGRAPGVYDPPQLVSSVVATAAALDNARRMAHALLGRGLQEQARGDPAPFVPAFRTVTALARTVRNGGGVSALEAGIEIERAALQAADRWLERLPAGHEQLTQALATAAAEGDGLRPFDLRPYLLADRFVIRGMMQGSNQWLTVALTPPGRSPEQAAAEADLVTFAWTVPWERERTRRLVGRAPDALGPDAAVLLSGRPGAPLLGARVRSTTDFADRDLYLRVLRRSLALKAAVRAYQARYGRPPAAQEELVTRGYLAALPEDPHAEGRPFGYRVSAGEELRGPGRLASARRTVEEPYLVPLDPGQVVVWSVGVDRQDQGGNVPPGGPRAEDIVFLVPPPSAPLPWSKAP